MSVVLFTGFPGFLGSALLPRVLARSPEQRAICVVQSKFIAQASARLAHIEAAHPHLRGRIELAAGDITQPNLGLEAALRIQERTHEIFHLAAVYDLSVPRDLALQVNVRGTRNVLDFADGAPAFRWFHHVSTCYVSGRYAGVFSEDDLEKGQSFNNHYEETKYLAEVDVRTRIRGGLPATVYRPSMVVGDRLTGATQKYDGPYFVIRWLLRQPRIALLPLAGNPAVTRANMVPQDFVVEAIAYLSRQDRSLGKTYQLADPEPMTVSDIVRVMGRATRRIVVRIPCSVACAKFAIQRVPGVYRTMQIPAAAIDYFVHPTNYACHRTVADLEGSGLTVPPFPTYVDRLVQFVRSHPDIGSSPMV